MRRFAVFVLLAYIMGTCGCAPQQIRPLYVTRPDERPQETPIRLDIFNVSTYGGDAYIEFITSAQPSVIHLHAAECFPHAECYHAQRDSEFTDLSETQHRVCVRGLTEGDYVVLSVYPAQSGNKAVFHVRDGKLRFVLPGWPEEHQLLGAK